MVMVPGSGGEKMGEPASAALVEKVNAERHTTRSKESLRWRNPWPGEWNSIDRATRPAAPLISLTNRLHVSRQALPAKGMRSIDERPRSPLFKQFLDPAHLDDEVLREAGRCSRGSDGFVAVTTRQRPDCPALPIGHVYLDRPIRVNGHLDWPRSPVRRLQPLGRLRSARNREFRLDEQ